MSINVYEGLFILDAGSYNRDAGKVSGQIASALQKHQGEIVVSRLWEERRLAYPIKGQRKGTYWLTYFRLDSIQLDALKRDFQLSDTILRSLILKVDPRIADALIQHALEEPKPAATGPGGNGSAAPTAAASTDGKKRKASDEENAEEPAAEAVADSS